MANVKNLAYLGTTGEIVVDGDTHAGVNAFTLTPTYPEEQITDIGGDVQVLVGAPTWRAAIDFNQDHKTTDSLSKVSHLLAGQVVPIEYTPQDGGDGRSVNVRMKEGVFGGPSTRHSTVIDLMVIGQPTVIEATP